MTQSRPLTNHLALCDDLYRLALEENQFLKAHGRAPDAALVARKQGLLERLGDSLEALRISAAPLSSEERRIADQVKARILQFLHLDRENEQRLLRCSLMGPRRPAVAAAPAMLRRAYLQGG